MTFKMTLIASLAAAAFAAPALAQDAAPPAPAAPAAPAALSVETTKIGDLMADPAGKAVMEKDIPGIDQYIDQIKDMTLSQVAPMSQGAIDDAKLKQIQADLDAIKR